MQTIFETPTHKVEIADGASVMKVLEAIRIITVKAFFRRLTFQERKILRLSAADTVVDLREDLQRSTHVDLDDTIEQQLLDTTLLSQSRIDALLIDGTAEES